MFTESGRKGLELFRSTCPDSVVLDLRIPDMKVPSILRQVRNLHPTMGAVNFPSQVIGMAP